MNRDSRKQYNREKLLDQGVRLLMERGYHGTGLQEVLDAVHIPKGSFYNYFPSKEAFGAEVIRHYIEPFLVQLQDSLANTSDPLVGLRGYFESLIEEAIRNDFKGGCLLGNLMGEIGDTSETCRQALKDAVERYRDKIGQALEQAQAQGKIRADLSALEMADLIVDYWQGALLRMKIERSPKPLYAFVRHVFEQVLSS
ncbi:MAG: TetR/AcrR family transcriptional regulator [Methylohalobius sp.]|nr:TetR/AcrR family transcriptional regulator [Methylohalobius sp.]